MLTVDNDATFSRLLVRCARLLHNTQLRRRSGRQVAIDIKIIERHAACCEALLEMRPNHLPRGRVNSVNGWDRFLFVFHDKPRPPRTHHFGDRPSVKSDQGSPASHSLDHHKAEWLRPVD